MSAPIASVDIANLALDHLGQQPVASIVNPADVNSDICARWYDQVRRQLLRKFVFNFARKTVTLTTNPNAPVHPEYVNAYSLPNDFIRLLRLGDRILYGGNIPTRFFDFSAGFLYCDNLTNQGTGVIIPQPVLQITAIYRSGDVIMGVTVPAGSTVVVVAGGTPIPGAQYTISGVVGSVQANGNTYLIVPGTLGNAGAVFFLQTAAGQNFNSSTWGVYVSGGLASPTFVPPGISTLPSGLEVNYTFDAVNVQQFDSVFIELLALQMAVKICKKITSKEPSDKLLKELRNAELSAAAVAGQEKPPMRVQRSRLLGARRPGGLWRDNTTLGWGP